MPNQPIAAVSKKNERDRRMFFIVDSDAYSLSYISTLLRRFDYELRTAATAADALELAKGDAPSLIITALDLADRDGTELMRDLRKDPRFRKVPFIALVNQFDPVGQARGLDEGAVDCLDQPVSPEALYRAVQSATEIKPRTCIRLRTLLPVEVNNLCFDELDGACASELSERGMFIQTSTPLDVKSRLTLELDLKGQAIVVEAIVLRTHRTAQYHYRMPGMGLEFVRIESDDRKVIRQFIRSEIMRDITPRNG